MSTTLKQAIEAAEAFRDLFAGCWVAWEIAGSIRREKAEVSDVDHVVTAKWGDATIGELFAQPTNLLMARCDELAANGTIIKHLYANGFKWGDKMRGCEYRGMKQEIHSAYAESWGAQLAIRTGPWEYSRMLVSVIQKRGYHNDDGYVWNEANNKVSVYTEQDYFNLCGVRWVHPKERK